MKFARGEVSAESGYEPHAEWELREIALRLANGDAFGSWNVPEKDRHYLPHIFLPLKFMSDVHRKVLARDAAIHFVGFHRDASEVGVNGYPCFFSMSMLTDDDLEKMREMLGRYL